MRIGEDTASDLLDLGPSVVATPSPEAVRLRDPEQILNRLAKIETPNERLREFALSIFDTSGTGTHEGFWIRSMAVYGTIFGWFFGGLRGVAGHHDNFVRNYNAAVFESNASANRLMFDKYIYRFITKGGRSGLAVGLLVTSAGVISLGSINYRNKLYLPDWILGFTTLGAVSRCWLGLRGVVAGGVLGTAAGLFGYGCARSLEIITGESVTYIRTLHHLQWKEEHEARLQHIRALAENHRKENPRFKV